MQGKSKRPHKSVPLLGTSILSWPVLSFTQAYEKTGEFFHCYPTDQQIKETRQKKQNKTPKKKKYTQQ